MQRGGEGEFRSSDGTFYTGGWSKDLINGHGRMEYSNGDCYIGNWFKNTVSIINHTFEDFQHGVKLFNAKCLKFSGFWQCFCSRIKHCFWKVLLIFVFFSVNGKFEVMLYRSEIFHANAHQ